MNPSVAVNITSVDKTEAGQKAAEARFGKFVKRTEKLSNDSGLGKFAKQVESFSKLERFGKGFDGAGRGLLAVSEGSKAANENVAALARGVFSFGGMAPAQFGAAAEAAGAFAGGVAAAVTAVVGLSAATYMLGDKWAKAGGKVDRTARSLGVTTDWLQSTQAAGERFGVTADQMTASVDALGSTLYDARYGANNLALGAMNQLGVKMKTDTKGAIDMAAAFDDITDAIARQTDPMVQKKLAGIFGLTAILPAIREGGAKLKEAREDYLKSGAALTPDELAKAKATEEKTVRARQHFSVVEKKLGVAALPVAGAMADKGVEMLPGAMDKLENMARGALGIGQAASDLAQKGMEAGRHLVEGAQAAAHEIARAVRAEGGSASAQATNFFQALGFSPGQARGMTAGAFAESGLNPNNVNPKSGAYGIGQWLGPRKAELFKRYGAHPGFDDQLAFMGWELTHSERKAGEAIKGASNPTEALDAYVTRYMRPAAGAETIGDLARGGHFLAGHQAKAQVEITLKNAPAGTVAKATGAPGVDVALNIHRSLEGAP